MDPAPSAAAVRVTRLSSLLYRPLRRPRLRLVTDEPSSLMDIHNRRGYYRIHFPAEARPRLLLDAPGGVRSVCEVIEVSERGLRFETPTEWLLPVGAIVAGTVTFARGAEARIGGSVVRVQEEHVALLLNRQALPLGVMLDEQRWLRANFALPE